jgi:phosphohistidine phosphatase
MLRHGICAHGAKPVYGNIVTDLSCAKGKTGTSMKTLALFRHAKSDWGDAGLGDFDRPLAPRGRKAAPRMGRAIRELGLVPDLILCSEARRARETWNLAGPEIAGKPELRFRRDLYLAAPRTILRAVQGTAPAVRTVIVIGHSPGMENLALNLCGPDSDPEQVGALRDKFPTAALAVLTFELDDWTKIGPGVGRLRHFLRPRDLD